MLAPFTPHQWNLGRNRSLELGPLGHIMGVINATPDSFSDGGMLASPAHAALYAEKLVLDGASILDIGAESTRPGAANVSGDEERARLLPILDAIVSALPDAVISVDTYRASTAEVALKAGAHIINDVWGLQKEPDIANIASEHGCGLVIMHTNREREALEDIVEDQKAFFGKSLEIANKAGISDSQIVLDPGFGFGKETAEINFQLLGRFDELLALGFPFLVGTSRKRFLGAGVELPYKNRDLATSATTSLLRSKGASIFRVHDVAINAEVLRICDAMLAQLR
ncbi:MAG: dihydropteroate synthase [Pseudomonadota bacterium]